MTDGQHKRPLWVGMITCALCPILVLEVLFQFSAEKNMMLVPDVIVILFTVPVSLMATFGVALPYTLWLKRRGKLNAVRLGIAGAVAGAATYAAFSFYSVYYPEMNDHAFMLETALTTALAATPPGAALGFFSAVALCLGAGIPITFRPPSEGRAP